MTINRNTLTTNPFSETEAKLLLAMKDVRLQALPGLKEEMEGGHIFLYRDCASMLVGDISSLNYTK